MPYRAVINFDFAATSDKNRYNELIAALEKIGWQKVGTSALAVSTDEIEVVLFAMNLFQKQCLEIGSLTALTFNCQQISPHASVANSSHKFAVQKIEKLPDPIPLAFQWCHPDCRAKRQQPKEVQRD